MLDLIARTRPTILEILKNRGFEINSYENQSPVEIQKLATASVQNLKIRVENPTDGKRCNVIYWVDASYRLKVENEVNNLFSDENPNHLNASEDEVILVLSEPMNDAFHATAVKVWNRMKAKIAFFHIKQLVTNPQRHKAVPPHRKLSQEEAAEVMKTLYVRSKSEFPRILYHIDMQARVLGLIPGEVVEIMRPSPTCAEYIQYRVCALA